MKRLLIYTIPMFLIGYLIANRTHLIYATVHAASPPNRVELTAVLLTRSHNLAGKERSQEITTYAIKASGTRSITRHRFIQTVSGGQREYNFVDITDLDKKLIIGVDSNTESTSTRTMSDSAALVLAAKPNSSCVDASTFPGSSIRFGQSQMLMGQKAIMEIQDRPLKDGESLHIERWLATDLDCFPIKELSTKTFADGRKALVDTELTSLTLGRPDDRYFQVPTDYVERAPSQIFAEAARREERSCTECQSPSMPIIDQAYFKNHK